MYSRLHSMCYLASLLFTLFYSCLGEKCGPLGFNAAELLKPGTWYLDLPKEQCPPNLLDTKCDVSPAANSTGANVTVESFCRIDMSLCKNMMYQCSGTVCAEYLKTKDLVAILGSEVPKPFLEGKNEFGVVYTGEKLPCTGGSTTSRVNITFVCNKNATWIINDTMPHHRSRAPTPVSASFDCDKCQYNIIFNYNGACFKLPPGESPETSISTGSIALILFFPGILLYFIVGILVNRTRGRSGKESIPHVQFWQDLPELIMDGFVFSMSVLTCRQEEGKTNYDTM